MNENELFNFYKEFYFWELERQDKINQRISVFLVIAIALAGFQSYIAKNCFPISCETFEIIGLGLLILSFLLFMIGIVYIKLSWHGHAYAHIPSLEKLETHRESLNKHFADDEDGMKKSEKKFKVSLFEYFIENSTNNFIVNNKKSNRFHITFYYLWFSTICALLSFIIFLCKEII